MNPNSSKIVSFSNLYKSGEKKYSQTIDCQLFKKIQLAFDHVCTPLKSEFDFNKQLTINNLTKYNSLQTLSSPEKRFTKKEEKR